MNYDDLVENIEAQLWSDFIEHIEKRLWRVINQTADHHLDENGIYDKLDLIVRKIGL